MINLVNKLYGTPSKFGCTHILMLQCCLYVIVNKTFKMSLFCISFALKKLADLLLIVYFEILHNSLEP